MAQQPIARDLSELRDHYTVVIVGSGYGGSIAASRLARAGQQVCLLERGREILPGNYPRTAEEFARHAQIQEGSHHVGDRRNLYTFAIGNDVNVFHGTGLGGTSLINANVSLRPKDDVLDDPRWPAALRADRAGLDTGFERAAAMLKPTTYPADQPPLAKVAAMKKAAGSTKFELTPINVNFRTGTNHVGVHQEACNGCGDCVSGCNYGAKNTLLMNYLPDAAAHGAEIFCEVEVRHLERTGDHWTVWYSPLGTGRGAFDAPSLSITADVVIVAAGTLGSNAILQRSKQRGLPLSAQLGKRFSGNGDMLGYAWGYPGPVHGVGAGPDQPSQLAPAGPCITSVIDARGAADRPDRMVIEDAAIPGAIGGLLPALLAPQVIPAWLRGKVPSGSGPIGMLRSAFSHGHEGAVDHVQTFLVMGLDEDEGRVVLRGDEATVEWPGYGERPAAVHADRRMAEAAATGGGLYVHSPIYDKRLHHDMITVHPLGGCVMADTAEAGVVDERGRAFSGATGTAVHEGLYVSDGSVIPVPLGVNPLFTISAVAERNVALLAADRGWSFDVSLPATAPPLPTPVAHKPGLRFSEKMSGFFSLGDGGIPDPDLNDLDVYRDAAGRGEAADSRLTFVLTLSTDDARAVLARLDAPMSADGTVVAPLLSPEPLTVRHGVFRLFVQDSPDPEIRHMWYRLPLEAVDGTRYAFVGYKTIQPGQAGEAWPATTTLYVTVHRDDEQGPVVGRGVLRIAPADFARQLSTMTTTGPVSAEERLHILSTFGRHFASPLLHDYGHLIPRSYPLRRNAPPRVARPLRAPTPVLHSYRSVDGLDLRLTRYQAGGRGPVVLSHGQGANRRTFTLDTVHTNLVEYLAERGFDIWVQEWRGSTELPTSRLSFNADEVARYDHPAAEQYIRQATGAADLHWLTHCIGSLTTTMSTLLGTITPASLLLSAVSMHTVSLRVQRDMVRDKVPEMLKLAGVRLLNSNSYDDESWRAKAWDQVLRLFPVDKEERCDQAVCHRLAFIYGDAVHHAALNDETHLTLHELFGHSNLEMMTHLGECAEHEKIVDAKQRDIYFDRLDFLRLPITFVHGAHNKVWLPVSTQRTYDLLVKEWGPEHYRRVVFPEFGHQDTFIGVRAADVVFPEVLAHLDRVGA